MKKFRIYSSAVLAAMLLLCAVSCQSQPKKDCLSVTAKTGDYGEGEWRIVYNKFYKKYAVMRIDSSMIGSGNEKSFLVKDHDGKYGVYGDGWWDCEHYYSCGDKSKSLFSNPCDAKQYLLTYVRKIKEDDWK